MRLPRDDVFFGQHSFDNSTVPDEAARRRLVEQLEERLASVPGIRRAALATSIPGVQFDRTLSIEGETYAKPEDQPRAAPIHATAGYFETLGVAVTSGPAVHAC